MLSSSTPGVLVTIMPRAVQVHVDASRPLMLATTFRGGALFMSSASSIRSVRQHHAVLVMQALRLRVAESKGCVAGLDSTSQCSAR